MLNPNTSSAATKASALYVSEWIAHRHLSDDAIASELGVSRETIWRWRSGKRKLHVETLVQLATVLDIEPHQFWLPPSRPSIDALLKYATDDVWACAYDIVSRLIHKPS
jgi:transcriptional regulator with XRE-family HTH domain